ncbi:putative bifunctional diguanylate cyclase/phosphodiesterase [Deinococcus gobiensis]|uniref:putative bifunctional diguanylate cyclase/phosphodiesterase n=1 Tax=Deinococcus gobiensis TaxID=502394 RepID=UPI0002D7DD37|nr:bifunctional diguanylate cyclase/phosphodiesterase [Deinococcus gobiensis]
MPSDLSDVTELERALAAQELLFWTVDVRTGVLGISRRRLPPQAMDPALCAQFVGLFSPGDQDLLSRTVTACVRQGGPLDLDLELHYPSGTAHWIQLGGALDPDAPAGQPRLYGLARNITAHKREQLALAQREAQLQAVLAQDVLGIVLRDLEGRVLLHNAHAQQATPELLEGDLLRSLEREVIATGRPHSSELDLRGEGPARVALTLIPYRQGHDLRGTVTFIQDVSRRRSLELLSAQYARQLEERVVERTLELHRLSDHLRYAAEYDELTGLLNRNAFLREVQVALDLFPAEGGTDVLLLTLIDLDRFKWINDRLGQARGDALLVQVAQRLRLTLGSGQVIARLGGDEFAALLRVPSAGQVQGRLDQLQGTLALPFLVGDRDVQISAGVGVAVVGDQQEAGHLLREAGIALTGAKSGRRGGSVVFRPWMREQHLLRLRLRDDLRHAAARGELTVYYQPVLNLRTGEAESVEALVRWQHPVHGLIGPGEFISIAEEHGLITDLDLWVLREACRFIRPLIQEGHLRRLSVNFSPLHFDRAGLTRQIEHVLHAEHFPASALTVEITEGLFLRDHRLAGRVLRELRGRGMQVAADDFGTGYSALSYMQNLPLSALKVDRSFVVGTRFPAIVHSIVDMAHALNVQVVAEGVETEQQLGALRQMHCDYGQGYLFSPPLPPERLLDWLAAHRPG